MSFKCIQQQHLPFSQQYCLFHTPTNQSFVSSLVIQPLALHLTTILLSSNSLGIISWFRITYSDNLLTSANTANVAGSRLVMLPDVFITTLESHMVIICYHLLVLLLWQLLASICCLTFTCIYMLPDIYVTTSFSLILLTMIVWGIEAHWIFVGISYLAHDVIGHLSRPVTCFWRATSSSLKSAGSFWQNKVDW